MNTVNITLSGPLPAGTYAINVPAAAPPPPPVVTGPAPAGSLMLRANGQFGPDVDGDTWSTNATIVHANSYDQVSTTGSWGTYCLDFNAGGQPLASNGQNGEIDTTGYAFVQVDLMPVTDTAMDWHVEAIQPGSEDVQGGVLSVRSGVYGPTPVKGLWATYKFPVVALSQGIGSKWRKFQLQDQGSNSTNTKGGTIWAQRNLYLTS